MGSTYVADTKEESEAKNELIAYLAGPTVLLDNICTKENKEINLLLKKPDGTEFLAPTTDQREQYIDELADGAANLGKAAGLWQEQHGWVIYGMEAVQRFLIADQKWRLADLLHEIASKLASGTAHISYHTPKVGPDAPTQDLKRKREEDFQELEETFLEASQIMRNFKKVEQTYRPTE